VKHNKRCIILENTKKKSEAKPFWLYFKYDWPK